MYRSLAVLVCLSLILGVVALSGCQDKPKPESTQTPLPGASGAPGTPGVPTPSEPAVTEEKEMTAASSDKTTVRITTNKGPILLELFDDKAPITAGNFLLLTEKGFYDGRKIFRVEPGFCIQTGDPQDSGRGGPGYTIPDELRSDLKHDVGVLSMAKTSQPNSGGSQFFICLGGPAATGHLDMKHSVFGKVVEGMDVVQKIQVGDVMEKVEVKSLSPHADEAKKKASAAQKPD